MSLSASTAWEVRPAGAGASDLNGGGYAGGGTDLSRQDGPAISVGDATASGTTTITSATAAFLAGHVGNVIYLAGGNGGLPATRRQVISVTNATTIVVDATVPMGNNITLNLGGALASLGAAGSAMVPGNTIWQKAGTYLVTSATANVPGGCLAMPAATSIAQACRVIGYNATRGDNPLTNRPINRASGIANFVLVTTRTDNHAEYLDLDGASLTNGRALDASGGTALRVMGRNCTNRALYSGTLILCEATGCTVADAILLSTASNTAIWCRAYANAGTGFAGGQWIGCVSDGNTGSNAHGFDSNGGQSNAVGCLAYGNGGDGFRSSTSAGQPSFLFGNCLAYGNGGIGFNGSVSTDAMYLMNCASGANTAGNTAGFTAANVVSFLTLTANPFTNSAGADYSLNSTAGGGALLRAAGSPVTFPGGTTTSHADVGASQHADPVATGGGISKSRLIGGL